MTDNRKVEVRKLLISPCQICRFCLKKAHVRQSPGAARPTHEGMVPNVQAGCLARLAVF